MLERALNDLRNPKTKTAYLQILATFTGADGSMGFTTGQRYELTRSLFIRNLRRPFASRTTATRKKTRTCCRRHRRRHSQSWATCGSSAGIE